MSSLIKIWFNMKATATHPWWVRPKNIDFSILVRNILMMVPWQWSLVWSSYEEHQPGCTGRYPIVGGGGTVGSVATTRAEYVRNYQFRRNFPMFWSSWSGSRHLAAAAGLLISVFWGLTNGKLLVYFISVDTNLVENVN